MRARVKKRVCSRVTRADNPEHPEQGGKSFPIQALRLFPQPGTDPEQARNRWGAMGVFHAAHRPPSLSGAPCWKANTLSVSHSAPDLSGGWAVLAASRTLLGGMTSTLGTLVPL